MAACRQTTGIAATPGSQLGLNNPNLMCEMNGAAHFLLMTALRRTGASRSSPT